MSPTDSSAPRWGARLATIALIVSAAAGTLAQDGRNVRAVEGGAQNAAADLPLRERLLPRADELIARFDCLACHAPDAAVRKSLDPSAPPRLEGITARAHPDWITAFLEDPRGTRPGTTHPHQLAGLPEASRRQVALDLAHFIARQDDVQPIRPRTETSTVGELEDGRALYHSVGCAVCHRPLETDDELGYSLAELSAPLESEVEIDSGAPAASNGPAAIPARPGVLEPAFQRLPDDLEQRQLPSELAAYLLDPVAVRPSGHCPSMSLDAGEAKAIAAYLLRAQAQRLDGTFEVRPGLVRMAYELKPGTRDPLDALGSLEPVTRDTTLVIDIAGAPRQDWFGLRFTGWLDVPEDGEYTFHLGSDDGSRLFVDGLRVVDHGGVHPYEVKSGTVALLAGKRTITVDMFEAEGEQALSLEWEGPGVERAALAPERLTHWPLEYRRLTSAGTPVAPAVFAVDQTRATRGAVAFEELSCVTCHSVAEWAPRAEVDPGAPSLERLNGVRPGVFVCLRPKGRYDFTPEDAGALLSAFVAPTWIAFDVLVPRRSVERAMVRRNCYGCHVRDGIGGVHPSLDQHFLGDEGAELGDQGRYPPVLSAVGRKLRPAVLEAAIHGHERIRPYLATRMPKVGDQNLAQLGAALRSVDLATPSIPPLAEAQSAYCGPSEVDDGRRLAGTRGGLGCVQCHDFRGTASLGVRAIDLREMHRRLRFDWFRELLVDPSSVDLNGRMASFWIDGETPVKDIAGGDIDAQIKALWCWLAEGDGMAPPPGLDTGPWAYEIVPADRTRLVAVFMQDVSPRVVCVGTPEGVHAAFDVDGARLAKLWRGRFLNAMGTWNGRAGALESPGSADVFELPPGPVVAACESLVVPWPREFAVAALAREVGDDGSVTFEYTVGELTVSETIRPIEWMGPVPPGSSGVRRGLSRTLKVSAPAGGLGSPVIVRIATARRFNPAGRGVWRETEGWPAFRVLGESARTAQIVRPDPNAAVAKGAGDEAVPVDVPEFKKRVRLRTNETKTYTEELRIPLLLRPTDPGAKGAPGRLEGTVTWEFVW